MQELRNQVHSLTDHVARLQDQIAEISEIVSNLQQREIERSFGPPQIQDHDGDSKKRKVGLVPSSPVNAAFDSSDGDQNDLIRMSAISNDPHLMQILNNEQVEEDALDTEELDLFIEEWKNLNENGQSISSASSSTGGSNGKKVAQSSFGKTPSANQLPLMTDRTDISSLIATFTPEMKTRFVDKLADTFGKQLTSMGGQGALQPESLQQPQQRTVPNQNQNQNQQGFTQSTQYSSSQSQLYSSRNSFNQVPVAYPNSYESDKFSNFQPQSFPVQDRHLYTSGGSRRLAATDPQQQQQQQQPLPDIALPLASAALNAFMMSNLQGLEQMSNSMSNSSSANSNSGSSNRDNNVNNSVMYDYQI